MRFTRWLTRSFYREAGKAPSAQALTDARAAMAAFDGPELPIFVRVAGHEGAVYLDLCNDYWEVAEVTASGWRVVGGGQGSESDKHSRYPRSWPEPNMAHLQWGRFPRSIDLEGEILTFLARFEVATPRQLMRWYPIHKHFDERGEYYPRAAERFFDSEERACDYLDAMRSEDLLTSNAPRFRSDMDSIIRPTEKGVELVGLGSVCEPHRMPMHGWGLTRAEFQLTD